MLECSNCGKSDKLHDEGDTVYCSHCAQRTLKSSGEIYLTKCPECGEMTRGSAAYCDRKGEPFVKAVRCLYNS